jgi:putative tricarboxylic transport membrane protein
MSIENIFYSFLTVFQLKNLLLLSSGTFIGIIFGALPGFTAGMGVAVLIPLTFGMDPISGLLLLAGVYNGAIYGGSITAILLHTPGTPAAAATVIDGYEMTKKGKAAEALRVAVTASAFGGIFSAILLLLIAPPLANIALKFGPPEYFLLAVFGLTIIASLSTGSFLKAIISGIFGLFIGAVGLDPILSYPRFTFGSPYLLDGVSYVPALIGLFALSQVFIMVEKGGIFVEKEDKIIHAVKGRLFCSLSEIKPLLKTFFRSSVIGTFIGMLPGAGASIASFLGYSEAKRTSKHPEKFGTGIGEGVAACEAANNAVTGGSLIPLLTLGIPGNSVTAILLGGLMIHGLRPGFELFTEFSNIIYPFILGLLFGNIIMFFMGTFFAQFFAKIAKLPKSILVSGICVFAIMGAYAINSSTFDIWILLIFGALGYVFRKAGFSTIAVVLGIILGPIAETGIKQSLMLGRGHIITYFLTRPICVILIILIVLSLITQYIKEGKSKKVEE